jgi:hypothetical protein
LTLAPSFEDLVLPVRSCVEGLIRTLAGVDVLSFTNHERLTTNDRVFDKPVSFFKHALTRLSRFLCTRHWSNVLA